MRVVIDSDLYQQLVVLMMLVFTLRSSNDVADLQQRSNSDHKLSLLLLFMFICILCVFFHTAYLKVKKVKKANLYSALL